MSLQANRSGHSTSAAHPISSAGSGNKIKAISGFTAKYGVDRLVWYEARESLAAAAQRERQIKEWRRAWKIQLIERDNPHWADLYPNLQP
jgi:putative endonuclease